MTKPTAILGWDIGGVNTKVTRLRLAPEGPVLRSVSLPYEVQRSPEKLGDMLLDAASRCGAERRDVHAVTMTAELSQAFRTKREGVGFVLDSLQTAFPNSMTYVFTVDGQFIGPGEARSRPLLVGASNWAATASWVGRMFPTCVLIDIGTTSSDLIPIIEGRIAAIGQTDPERLLSGELVYSGALRTPAEAVAQVVPLWGGQAGVAADGFALIGDAHLWRGRLASEDYTCLAPDGRPATKVFAGERLARMVCADRDMLDDSAIDAIATALADAQVRTLVQALERIRARWPAISLAIVTGLGDFVAREAAQAAGLATVSLEERLGAASRTAPAAAVAWLLAELLDSKR
jgi:(4-(4-[2-(gamma-L-glutamylamino)ethyl]phenoxymethyl)furan-2-yl)methanamine synthase